MGQHGQSDGTLGDELTLVDRYLAIAQLRLGARLQVQRELETLPHALPLPRRSALATAWTACGGA